MVDSVSSINKKTLQQCVRWVRPLFQLCNTVAFHWAKVRSEYRVKPKSEITSLSLWLSRNFGLSPKLPLSEKAQRKWS